MLVAWRWLLMAWSMIWAILHEAASRCPSVLADKRVKCDGDNMRSSFFGGWFVIHRQGLATIDLSTKSEVYILWTEIQDTRLLSVILPNANRFSEFFSLANYWSDECRWGGLKLATFDDNCAVTRQVYLLTLMDRAMLLHVKSTIVALSIEFNTRQRASDDLHTPRNVGYYRIFER